MCENRKKTNLSCSVAVTEEAEESFCSALLSSNNFLPLSTSCHGSVFRDSPRCPHFHLLVLLLLLFEEFVDLPLGHAGVLGDDAMLVQAGQQQQEAHCEAERKNKH